jgi:dihydroorotase
VPLTLDLVDKGLVSLKRWVESMTVAPAKLLKLPHGTLQKGRDADVTVIRHGREWQLTAEMLKSKSHNSPFLGWKFKSQIACTIVGGKVVFE